MHVKLAAMYTSTVDLVAEVLQVNFQQRLGLGLWFFLGNIRLSEDIIIIQ